MVCLQLVLTYKFAFIYMYDLLSFISLLLILLLITWPKLFKRQIALTTTQISIQWIAQLVSLIFFQWMVIYPMDSSIQLLKNWGLEFTHPFSFDYEVYTVKSKTSFSTAFYIVSICKCNFKRLVRDCRVPNHLFSISLNFPASRNHE